MCSAKNVEKLSRRWFAVKEAAAYMGLTPGTLYNWSSHRTRPPFVKCGGSLLFDLHDLDGFLQSRKAYPQAGPDVRSPLERGAVRVVPGGIFS